MIVQSILDNFSIPYKKVELGSVELEIALTTDQYRDLDSALRHYELEIMSNKRIILVERIKSLLLEMIHSNEIDPPIKFSVYLSKALNYDYAYLSNIFTEEEGSTIERFYITSRIERIKELIRYEDMSIKEIANRLNYSSLSHLCLQFKKVTGETPSGFRKLCQSPGYIWRKL